MKYYSTNRKAPEVTLQEAVVRGLAPDKGLYMPERIKSLPQTFFEHMPEMSLQEMAYQVADAFFGEDVPAEKLRQIVFDTLSFEIPLVSIPWSFSMVLPSPLRMWVPALWRVCWLTSTRRR